MIRINHKNGFSLVELTVVLMLAGVSSLVLMEFTNFFTQRKTALTNSEEGLAALILPLEQLRADTKIAKAASLNAQVLTLEFEDLNSTSNLLNRIIVRYSYDSATKILQRSLQNLSTGAPAAILNFPNFKRVDWCLDEAGANCNMGIDRYASSSKRLVAEFWYENSFKAEQSLPFIADLNNIPFDCRGSMNTFSLKATR